MLESFKLNMLSDTPLVSILMPAYNVQDFIGEAIKGVLAQTYENFELIILNDGSTDDTVKIVESFSDIRIKLYHNEKNLGLSETRNRLFELARGNFYAIHDSDDVSCSNRIEKQVKFMRMNPKCGLLGSWITVINKNGEPINKIRYFTDPKVIRTVLLFENCFAQSTIMIRGDFLPKLRYRNEFPPIEDYELWTRISILKDVEVCNIPEYLVMYRVHNNNITSLQANRKIAGEKLLIRENFTRLRIHFSNDDVDLFYNLLSRERFDAIKNIKIDKILSFFSMILTTNEICGNKFYKRYLGFRYVLFILLTRNKYKFSVYFNSYFFNGLIYLLMYKNH